MTLWPHIWLELVGNEAPEDVDRARGRERNHHADRPGRILLRAARRSDSQQRGNRDGDQTFHDGLPFQLALNAPFFAKSSHFAISLFRCSPSLSGEPPMKR